MAERCDSHLMNMKSDSSVQEHKDESLVEFDPKREQQLVRKIDWHLMPMIVILTALNLYDRSNISSARILGMQVGLNLVGNQFNTALLVFFPGYIVAEIPANSVIAHIGAKWFIPSILTLWGVIAMCQGFVNNWSQLVGLRVLLGLFEGGFTPGCIYLMSVWYKRYELQKRIAIYWTSALLIQGLSGVLSYLLSLMDGKGGLAGWRWVFIVPGAITIAIGLVSFFFFPDFPHKVSWLSPEERLIMLSRINKDRGDGTYDRMTVRKIFLHLSDWRIYPLCINFMLATTSTYALGFFLPTILQTFGFNVALSNLLVFPPYVLAVLVSLTLSWLGDRTQHRCPQIIGLTIVAIIGFITIGWAPNTGGKLTGVFLAIAGTFCTVPPIVAFLGNNLVGQTKRGVVHALQSSFGALGGIIGSLVFRSQDAPGYKPGLYAVFTSSVLLIISCVSMSLYFHRMNKRADKEGIILENTPGFRYTL